MRPSRPRKAAFFAAGLAAALAGGEIACRAIFSDGNFDRYRAGGDAVRYLKLSDSPRLLFEPAPPPAGGTAPAPRVNARGFRDGEWAETEPDVLVLGDWVAWGRHVADGEDFPARLERGLGAPVHNAAVPGYSLCQETALFKERLADLRPKRVLAAYCLNDRAEYASVRPDGESWRAVRRVPTRVAPNRLATALARRSALADYLFWRLSLEMSGTPAAARFLHEDRADVPALACLDELAGESARRNAALAVAVFPVFGAPPGARAFFERERRLVIEGCRARGIPALDLSAAFEAAGGDLASWRARPGDHTHPNAAAHAVAAKALLDFLRKEKPLATR